MSQESKPAGMLLAAEKHLLKATNCTQEQPWIADVSLLPRQINRGLGQSASPA
jgi:hypothetical protein